MKQHRQTILILCLCTCFGWGCGPRYLGLKQALVIPKEIRVNRVQTDREERRKAIAYFKDNHVSYGLTVGLLQNRRTGRIIRMGGRKHLRRGFNYLYWKELFEISNPTLKAKLEAQQKPKQILWGTSALVLGLGALGGGIGWTVALFNQPKEAQSSGIVVYSIGMTLLTLTGVILLSATPGLYMSDHKITPKGFQMREAVRVYNQKLLKKLKLKRSRPQREKIRAHHIEREGSKKTLVSF